MMLPVNAHEKKHVVKDKPVLPRVTMAAIMLLIGGSSAEKAIAAAFDPAFEDYLVHVCTDGLFKPGSNLAQVCPGVPAGGGPVGSISVPTSSDGTGVRRLEQRLQSFRESKEEQLNNETRGTYAMNTSEQFAESDALQLPSAGGTSPDVVFGTGAGPSAFISAGAYALNHHNNRFEDGYEAQLPTVTAGADYPVNDWLLAGLAFNYTNYDGTYDDGGGFDKHIFGPLLYATVLPFQGAFANVVLGYARQENRNNRLANAANTPAPLPVGHTSADYSENQYIASVLTGYDQPFGNVTIGPRAGLAFSYESFDSIKEEGDTGLELKYTNLNQTSVQSSLGMQASLGWETAYGMVVPQASAAWVHEYANSERNVDARLVEATPEAGSFTFTREPPARDWAVIDTVVSVVLSNGLQPFVTFSTIQGNENFVSYGGTAGLRFGL
jgi:uncharacterized protein YhjY with autotransporter beta-barrel domain